VSDIGRSDGDDGDDMVARIPLCSKDQRHQAISVRTALRRGAEMGSASEAGEPWVQRGPGLDGLTGTL